MFRIHRREGFAGQIHTVIPRHFLQEVAHHPLLHALFPTDMGWYPQAHNHYRERNAGVPEHILIYCVAGSGWVRIHDKTHTILPGSALVIPGGTPHTYSAALGDPWSIHWIHFRGEIAYQFMQQLLAGQYVIEIHPKAHTPLIETFQECYDALAGAFTIRQMIFCALAIHRIFAWIFFGNPSFASSEPSVPPAIDRALVFMRDHLHERPTLTAIADHCGVSVSHFSAQFKDCLGISPIDYFIDLKMQYACYLLETTRLSVKEIAFALAYDDPYYFSRLFRKVIGTSPAHYRRSGQARKA